jgi:hypothetical protein
MTPLAQCAGRSIGVGRDALKSPLLNVLCQFCGEWMHHIHHFVSNLVQHCTTLSHTCEPACLKPSNKGQVNWLEFYIARPVPACGGALFPSG